jgi:hypothetical protein
LTTMPKTKRGYSRDFPKRETRRTLTIGNVPPQLLVRFRARTKREGISMRALLLTFIQDWTDRAEQEVA